jgi:predicted dehydrogenase
MKTRREFVKNVVHGAFSVIAVSLNLESKRTLDQSVEGKTKKIRIGIIGAENSHTIGFGQLFNINKKFPGVEVLYVWGETDEFAKNAAEKGSIPNIVKDPMEMMGNIDALIVDHRHAKYHLEAALPFVKAGIPTFIDKPFCYRVAEGKKFLQIAEELKTPVTSFSSVAQSNGTLDIKAQVSSIKNIEHIVMFGRADIESKYGGVFFYGVHIVQPMLNIFGEDVERVRITRHGKGTTASVVFQSGYFATLIFTQQRKRGLYVITDEGEKKIEPAVTETDPPKHYKDMVEMFRTGKEPRSHQSILKCVAVLEALEKSVKSQQWEKVII